MSLNNYTDKYQTIGSRFIALTIDGVIFIPIMIIGLVFGALIGSSPLALFIGNVLSALMFAAYYILAHGFYGQTVGKSYMNIKVVDISERNINIGQATLRYLPNLIPLIVLIGFGHPQFLAGNVSEMELYLGNILIVASQIFTPVWTIADIIVCFSSGKHRALHDFIAGTVVIKTDI